ncbi:MAG: hypothetical protein AMJ90_05925 [candidate division Zixibacteria bacterium SM23_73_2]|nr:MAG: hypothetical protein AMJ90_05925 [candidate division Zixibacteria bacterium SM23_73_2]
MKRRFRFSDFMFDSGFRPFGLWFTGPWRYPKKEEYLRMLEEYKKELEAELKEVEKEIGEVKKE